MAVDSARSLQYEYKAVSEEWWVLFRIFHGARAYVRTWVLTRQIVFCWGHAIVFGKKAAPYLLPFLSTDFQPRVASRQVSDRQARER